MFNLKSIISLIYSGLLSFGTFIESHSNSACRPPGGADWKWQLKFCQLLMNNYPSSFKWRCRLSSWLKCSISRCKGCKLVFHGYIVGNEGGMMTSKYLECWIFSISSSVFINWGYLLHNRQQVTRFCQSFK